MCCSNRELVVNPLTVAVITCFFMSLNALNLHVFCVPKKNVCACAENYEGEECTCSVNICRVELAYICLKSKKMIKNLLTAVSSLYKYRFTYTHLLTDTHRHAYIYAMDLAFHSQLGPHLHCAPV